MTIIRIDSLDDPAGPDLGDYIKLTDVALRTKFEPEGGLYIAESSNVIRRALAANHRMRSMLMAPRYLESMADVIASLPDDVPVYVTEEAVLESITGFHLHRGAIAAMHRPELPQVPDLLNRHCPPGRAARVAVLEDLVDHTNLGAAFRSAAALGVDAVLITPRCADPLYRRSVRVSMGTVFQVPWTRLDAWPLSRKSKPDIPGGMDILRQHGFTCAALALNENTIDLSQLEANPPDRLAVILGTEGAGLSAGTIAASDIVVKIPMAGKVDSLNVAAAAAVAFWATRPR
ncbi:RNA methyltransferase [Rarobacter faecitabidus]|uniref:tRNA G18 (Ribose-2'-O)-methylase SpoU n=1 Tax=Rarobacter faecitabidus TaxID=13243 RepID=A0A542ZVY9_RARFA|nr:RNA methyltransferase [Rarobacter faecitabidus]TQL64360.1 tRNA G18 (ribose-2'-O)-methylase SpoU [Rarobacter faecitabidus]